MKKKALSITAICLAVLLLCGGACFGTAAYIQNHVSITAESSVSGIDLQSVRLQSQSSAESLTANEIYELACRQVVASAPM